VIADMPRGGPDASWLDRRLQTDLLEYTDRYDIPDDIKQRVVGELDRLGDRRGFHEKFARIALSRVADVPEPRILELGAGHGKLSREILRQHASARVTVSDLDPTSVANIAAGPLGSDPRATVRVVDAADIDAAEGSFDLVVFAQSFHHLPPDLAARAIAEATRVGREFLVIDLRRLPAPMLAVFPVLSAPLMLPQLLRRSGRETMHDGIISMLRSYSPSALTALGTAADPAMIVEPVDVPVWMLNGISYRRPR
jgi:SAM-dependent methyltransferase